jgi:hypothetical protein
MSLRNLRRSAIVLFLLSVIAWPFLFIPYDSEAIGAFISFGNTGPWGLLLFSLLVVVACANRSVAWSIEKCLTRLSRFSESRVAAVSVLVAAGCAAMLYFDALAGHRRLMPAMHDEFSYLIQARQLAAGHLWMPRHPLGDFFDSFQLLIDPVYASAYFPGTALLYVPGVWLHLPPFVTALCISGIVAGLIFYICVEMIGGIGGWLGVLLLVSNHTYRQLSVMSIGQMPLLLYALAAVVVWLRWRKSGSAVWAILVGAFLGLAAITRPVDALCYGIPIGLAVLFDSQKQIHHSESQRGAEGQTHRQFRFFFSSFRGLHCGPLRISAVKPFWFRPGITVLLIVAGAFPFLCFQLVLDRGITGRWLTTPFDFYAQRDYPDTSYGFHPYRPDAKPVSVIQQKQALYQLVYKPQIEQHRWSKVFDDFYKRRGRQMLSQQTAVPYPLLVTLCPLCVLRLNRTRWVLLVTFPLLVVFYAAYVFFMPHYVMTFAPALILSMLMGAEAIAIAAGKYQRFVTLSLTLFIAGNAIAGLPNFTGADHDIFSTDLLAAVNQQIATLPHRPAVVLFKFDPTRVNGKLDEEPVYNADVAWPDDAVVIRAHDLGARNHEIFEYYAQRQPDRFFYRFDEASGRMVPLGYAKTLIQTNVER